MAVIQLSAGRKHTIRVGDKTQEVTLRPGEVQYMPFVREALDIPTVEPVELPKTRPKTYVEWSGAIQKPTLDDIISLVEGVRGRKDIGFKPTFDNLVSLLKKYRK